MRIPVHPNANAYQMRRMATGLGVGIYWNGRTHLVIGQGNANKEKRPAYRGQYKGKVPGGEK